MFAQIESIIAQLKTAVASWDPSTMEPAEALRAVALLSEGERICAAARTLTAGRVAATRSWRDAGYQRPSLWLAETAKMTEGQAIGALKAARELADLEATRRAFASGVLSEPQARAIASAATAAPFEEARLLELSERESVKGLRQECLRVLATAVGDADARYRKVHAERYVRFWSDEMSASRVEMSLTPDIGGEFKAQVVSVAKRLRRKAIREGRHERWESLQADALAEILAGARASASSGEPPSRPPVDLNVIVDYEALVRGHALNGEASEILGVGPVPVAVVRKMASDAVLSVLVRRGGKLLSVAPPTYTIPRRVKRAVRLRDKTCKVVGCDDDRNLQLDHVIPWPLGPSTETNIEMKCKWHHDMKTAGLFRDRDEDGNPVWERINPEKPIPPPRNVADPVAPYGVA